MSSNNTLQHQNGPLPASAGSGLKPLHFLEIVDSSPGVGFFEIHSENYLVPGGPMLHYLDRIRQDYPLSFHCVGMSPGSALGINENHVKKIRALADSFEPGIISDHLSWSSYSDIMLNDLLPLPYSDESFALVSENIDRIQQLLGRSIAIENPSSYLLPGSETGIAEAEFLTALAQKTGAGILLDINNVYVSACNHGWSAEQYIQSISPGLIREMHLAGHKRETEGELTLLIDDHGSRVADPVWQLFEMALSRTGPVPVLLEWDTDVPAFSVLLEEAGKAQKVLDSVCRQEKTYA